MSAPTPPTEGFRAASIPVERSDAALSAVELLLRLHRSVRVIIAIALLAGIVIVAVELAQPREFVAPAQLATISARSLSATPGIVAALGGLQGGGGVQATPGLIVELSRTNDVLYKVGTTTMGGRRLVDLLAEREKGHEVPDELIPEKVRLELESGADGQTGLIHFAITHRDSAVARRAMIALIDEVNQSYLAATQAQARAIAAAQSNRIDSASAHLMKAETQLLEFARGNRTTLPYSEASLGRTRLERERDFAQTLYTQAVADRDAAVGRALEETPALIVIDPVPAKLKPKSRGLAAKGILTVLAVLALSLLWMLAQMKLEGLAASTSSVDRSFAAIFMRRRKDVPLDTRGS